MNLESIRDYCGEKLSEGIVTQAALAEELQSLAKRDPKKWQVGSSPDWSSQKLAYYLRKWGLVESKAPKPDFIDIPIKTPSAAYVMVMVPQDKLTDVLGVL